MTPRDAFWNDCRLRLLFCRSFSLIALLDVLMVHREPMLRCQDLHAILIRTMAKCDASTQSMLLPTRTNPAKRDA